MDEQQLIRWRRDLHRMPELGHQEFETAAYLEHALQEMGLQPKRLTATGMIADIHGEGGPGPTVVLRADMDGLPLEEETGEPFSSDHPGIMHACGHDAHMTAVLGAAQALVDQPNFPGTVRILFQPSEEKPPGGAPDMIQAGCLEGVDVVLGLHIWNSYPVGTVAIKSGALMANADQFTIRIHGRGGHGSEPQATQDAVLIAAETVVNLQTIVSRRVSPLEPAVVTAGTLNAGVTFNIIAEEAVITGTVRTFSQETQDTVEREIRRLAEGTAALYEAHAEVDYVRGYPVVLNHEPVVRAWEPVLREAATVIHPDPSMGGEDFAYYLQHRPGAFLFLGGQPDGEVYPHHSPHFRFSEKALPIGVRVLEDGARLFLHHPEYREA